MSEVNKTVYPDRTTALSGVQLTSTQLSSFSLNSDWETSIAVSQSMSENAPYNRITYITLKDDEMLPTYDATEIHNDIQKIALFYTQNLINMAQTQYYNGSISYSGSSFNISQLNDAPYNFYSMRRAPVVGDWTVNLINTLQQRYNKNASFLITGADFKKILCVICVGFTSGNYCSLKYYLDNKTTLNLTPSNLFMIGLIDNDGSSTLQTMCSINMSPIKYHFWQKNEQTGVITEDERTLQTLFPMPVLRTITPVTSARNIGATNVGTMAFPLIGCMGDGRMNLTNYWVSKPAAGTPIFGGENDYHYTLHVDGSFVYTHLSQYAFDDVMSVAACYGLPFAIDFPQTLTNFYNDATINTYIPIANDGGYFNGRFEPLTVAGVLNSELSLDNLEIWNGGKNAPYNGRTYDPNVPIPTDSIELTQPSLTAIDAFNRTYIIDGNSVDDLGDILWSADSSIIDNIIAAYELYGEKPINGIINLMLFPFDVRAKTGATENTFIKIGTYNTGIAAYRLPTNANAVYDFGSFKWERLYNNFLDFEPFTTAELYVPFFGMFPLQNSHFIGKTIDIKVAVDFITGAATCIIYVSDNGIRHPVIYKNATIGVQIPISGDDASGRVHAILDNALKGANELGNAAKSAAVKDIGGAVTNTISGAIHIFGADAVPTMYQTAGSSTPECSLYLPKKPYIILYTPEIIESTQYNNDVGYATFEDVTIGSCSGFCKFDNIELSGIVATDAEKTQIANALSGGVYL